VTRYFVTLQFLLSGACLPRDDPRAKATSVAEVNGLLDKLAQSDKKEQQVRLRLTHAAGTCCWYWLVLHAVGFRSLQRPCQQNDACQLAACMCKHLELRMHSTNPPA